MKRMNEYRIVLTHRAKDDIIDIGDYITYTLLEPDTSKNFIKGLRNSISQLIDFPYKFPLVQDDILQRQGIHYMPYKNYYVFYEVVEMMQVVIIIRVCYKRRNWKELLSPHSDNTYLANDSE